MTENARTENQKGEARRVFARRLKEIRIQKGFSTARSLANSLGIDENRYTRYERAEVEPDLHLIGRMCDVLGVHPNDLLLVSERATRTVNGNGMNAVERPNGHSLNGALQGGPPGDGHSVVDGLAWKLGCLVARVRVPRDGGNGAADGNGAGLAFLQAATALYGELTRNPFRAIGDIVKDPAVLATDAETQAQIDALCLRLAEARALD